MVRTPSRRGKGESVFAQVTTQQNVFRPSKLARLHWLPSTKWDPYKVMSEENFDNRRKLHWELTEQILAAAMEVSTEVGPGLAEIIYENSMAIALADKGLRCTQQLPLNAHFRGHLVGEFKADMDVEEKVLLELKSVRALSNDHKAQLINYLNLSGREVGLLINFGNLRLQFQRLYRGDTIR